MSQTLQVSEISRETADSILITFSVPQSLRKQYKSYPGQFITIEAQVNGKTYKRPYSLCSNIDQDSELSILVKRVDGGVVSNYLNDHAEAGSTFKVQPPQGSFISKPSLLNINHYVFFAAGCGITPIITMIESIMKKEKFSKVTLLYSNKSWDNVIFRKRLSSLQEEYGNKLQVMHFLSTGSAPGGVEGRLSQEKCKALLTQKVKNCASAKYYLCGPTSYMETVINTLNGLQVPTKNIKYECFNPDELSLLTTGSNATPTNQTAPGIDAEVQVLLDNKMHVISVKQNQSILDSALAADLDANYSCRSGACSSCKAKLVSGQVTSKNTSGLTQKEIAEGYILTCQSQPVTPGVKIEYCL